MCLGSITEFSVELEASGIAGSIIAEAVLVRWCEDQGQTCHHSLLAVRSMHQCSSIRPPDDDAVEADSSVGLEVSVTAVSPQCKQKDDDGVEDQVQQRHHKLLVDRSMHRCSSSSNPRRRGMKIIVPSRTRNVCKIRKIDRLSSR